jgi:hypothetical protein
MRLVVSVVPRVDSLPRISIVLAKTFVVVPGAWRAYALRLLLLLLIYITAVEERSRVRPGNSWNGLPAAASTGLLLLPLEVRGVCPHRPLEDMGREHAFRGPQSTLSDGRASGGHRACRRLPARCAARIWEVN